RLSYQDEQGWRFKPIYYNREELQEYTLHLHETHPSNIEPTVHENHTKSTSLEASVLVGQVTDHKLDYDYDNEYPDYNFTDLDYNANTENYNNQDDKDYLEVGELTSNTQNQQNCLSVVFTARSITHDLTPGPIYGLAYSPNEEHQETGICSSANVAFVNLYVSEEVPYQPNTRTKLVFAHEVAHAFGAPHDNDKSVCGEYSVLIEPDEGYFLMHEVAVTEHRTSICGNGIVEEGEQCDCGSRCHLDNCCHRRGTEHECSLKKDAQCSPSQGPCCSGDTCRYYKQSENMNCKRSVCSLIGWQECELTNGAATLTPKEEEELCFVGCQKTKASPCISTHDGIALAQYPELNNLLKIIAERDQWQEASIRLPVGTPCNRMTGYCDVFQRCRGVDPDTPLTQLKNCFKKGGKCASLFVDFLSSKGGVFTLATVTGILLTIAFVKCFTVHTKGRHLHHKVKTSHRSVRESVTNVRHSVGHMAESVRLSVTDMRKSIRNSLFSRQNSLVDQELERLSQESDNVFEP
ncbi:ADA10-like protein, partial [Mya arenaria]